MSRTDELLREVEEETSTQPETTSASRRTRAVNTARQMFSPRYFLVSLVLTTIALFIAGSIPVIPATGLIGVFGVAFALGGFSSERRYLEVGLAGAVASGASMLSNYLTLAVVGRFGIEFVGAGAAIGAVVALLGYYFGRDLRGGLTKEIE